MSETGTAPRPARARNRRGEGSRLRDEIVTAAAELLDETGDERTITLRSIARRIGIAAPSIYPHFPDQPAIMLAVVKGVLDELTHELRTAAEGAGDDPRQRLLAVCRAYLTFGRERPERYRTMFGGLWMPTLGDNSLTEEDLSTLGVAAMQVLVDALTGCAEAGLTTDGSDPVKDGVALWVGMHGLAHQRIISRVYPWPDDIEERIITGLARLRTA